MNFSTDFKIISRYVWYFKLENILLLSCLKINIIAMEYPGYGAYTNYDKNQELSQ